MAPIFSTAAASFATEANSNSIRFGAVNCDVSHSLCAKRFGVRQFPTVYAFLAPVGGGSPSRATAEELEAVLGSRNDKLRKLIHQVAEKAEGLGVARKGEWKAGVATIAPMAREEARALRVKGKEERQADREKEILAERGGGPRIHRVDVATVTSELDALQPHCNPPAGNPNPNPRLCSLDSRKESLSA